MLRLLVPTFIYFAFAHMHVHNVMGNNEILVPTKCMVAGHQKKTITLKLRSEIANLVPSCHKCNSSKGNKDWDKWIIGTAKQSPKMRGVKNLDQKIKRLKDFENWREPTKVDFSSIVGKEVINDYWKKWMIILELLSESQEKENSIKKIIEEKQAGPITSKKKEMIEKKIHIMEIQKKKTSKQPDPLKRLLNDVDIEVFINYYYEFLDLSIPNKYIVENIITDFTKKSRISRTSI